MRDVIAAVNEYKKANPMPMDLKPAGTAYFNLVWNEEVLWDMVIGFTIALIVVFVILRFNFHSFRWAFVGYIPLVFTITLIYGVIGFMGKDFDMPISVLSTLSLGMAVDFAIHFISRFRQRLAENPHPPFGKGGEGDLIRQSSPMPCSGLLQDRARASCSMQSFLPPAFSVMLFAPLTPYITVGAFIVGMMLLSAVMTIIYIPALITLLQGWLFKVEV